MKSIVCFRCHDYPPICSDRVDLLRHYNPDIPICAIFGGKPETAQAVRNGIEDRIEHWFETQKQPDWNWRNGDLAVRLWYIEYGHEVEFDRMYLIEWDLVLLDSLSRLYSHVPSEAVAVTARFLLKDVAHDFGWTTDEPYKSQWEGLLNWVTDKYGYDGEPFVSLGPGTCYPRQFLERYCSENVPELSADELRVPLFAQCFGIPVYDTNFLRSWTAPEELQYFNCQNNEVSITTILNSVAQPDGRRAFHPYMHPISSIARRPDW